ncbi:aldehyde dehydrogenase family protein [Herbidospora yilanensis]|uniref:aldehyde dehydrogenase family protein n=1 Tax=Herbidospora yilanensis TaxID=354426 RepID=UPI000784471B|nr:aldehyde dehydrogenase family protein [Herbidospora yilanensis]
MKSRDKSTGETLGSVTESTLAGVDAAVGRAAAAQPAWAALPYTERAAALRTAAARLEAGAARVRDLIVRETGCIPGKADYEIGAAAGELHAAAALAGRPVGEVLPSSHTGRFSLAERLPLGVVAAITPWNFPLVLGMRVVAPALALGNTVVLKPSPETPLSGGSLFADLFADLFDGGVLQIVQGGPEVGERLVTHPGTAMVHFTGSTTVGRAIAAQAGGLLKKVSLELGGNNALVVLDDADLEQAAMIGTWSSFHYQGQTCITAGRHIVQAGIAEAYVAELTRRAAAITVGDPFTEAVGLGPMINERQFTRAARMLSEAVAAGASVLTGGPGDPPFFRPAVVASVGTGMRLWREEIFAPVAPVLVVADEEEAIRVVNDTEYGLVNAVVTADLRRGLSVARRLRGGMVHVNDATPQDEAGVPFGGIGQSGLGGRSGGDDNLEEFTTRRWLTTTDLPVHYPY